MERQTIQAKFASKEQAESAVRKLASLRGDHFRLERTAAPADASADFNAEVAAEDGPVESFGWANNAGETSGSAPFSLSASIPAAAADQARRVVRDHGGYLV